MIQIVMFYALNILQMFPTWLGVYVYSAMDCKPQLQANFLQTFLFHMLPDSVQNTFFKIVTHTSRLIVYK